MPVDFFFYILSFVVSYMIFVLVFSTFYSIAVLQCLKFPSKVVSPSGNGLKKTWGLLGLAFGW